MTYLIGCMVLKYIKTDQQSLINNYNDKRLGVAAAGSSWNMNLAADKLSRHSLPSVIKPKKAFVLIDGEGGVGRTSIDIIFSLLLLLDK